MIQILLIVARFVLNLLLVGEHVSRLESKVNSLPCVKNGSCIDPIVVIDYSKKNEPKIA
jgi:hypothetical protein